MRRLTLWEMQVIGIISPILIIAGFLLTVPIVMAVLNAVIWSAIMVKCFTVSFKARRIRQESLEGA